MLSKVTKGFVIAAVAATSIMAADKISGAGATFPAPCYYDWAYNYQKATHTRVNYQAIGSGGGIKQISERIVDFGGTDAPMTPKELAAAKLLQFPAVIGSIDVVVNIPGVADEQLKLKNSVVADIFAGKITMWNDAAIAADNAGVKLPAEKIIVAHRSDGSGTTYVFTDFLSEASKNWKSQFGVGKAIGWATGIGGKGNEGVTNLIKQTPYTIGYVENAYKEKNHLTAATLQTASGKWVSARTANFQEAVKQAKWSKKDSFYSSLVMQNGDKTYPIVAATFILMPKEKAEANQEVIKFFDYAYRNGDAAAVKLGYIPLPVETTNLVREYWAENK
ncbi:phosphate ABC transporter substrate-binding protein PstS [Sulfuricurvum sp.]|uniref:phosphate ABC transporter substrate-binding protein PstS n=1 Tax=Sulfuricurvum sp. TaxID=2025608 RepID=UPI002635B752|nr:phosphate ABC transporter substrate-binding protein PstS [Sulfuricurvum sp.]MDD2267616.1 phosphate ABC transporter substrate-binding protein PstS [Sulfuricurvum sp.]MDD2783452.1 phosphate ABC transporter substrate-binding protein PstS [Sulfuricurvum sp.]